MNRNRCVRANSVFTRRKIIPLPSNLEITGALTSHTSLQERPGQSKSHSDVRRRCTLGTASYLHNNEDRVHLLVSFLFTTALARMQTHTRLTMAGYYRHHSPFLAHIDLGSTVGDVPNAVTCLFGRSDRHVGVLKLATLTSTIRGPSIQRNVLPKAKTFY